MSAPVGSLRWQAGLLASTLGGVAIALSPAWWAVACFWDLQDRVRRAYSRGGA